MAHDAPQATGPSKLVIRNIGLLLSGALEKPILDADTIVAENGKITAIGRLKDVDIEGATTVVDAHGTTVTPATMERHATFDYLRGDGYQAVELPYAGARLGMVIVLPDPASGPGSGDEIADSRLRDRAARSEPRFGAGQGSAC